MTDTTTTFDLPGFRGTLMRPGGAAYDEARKVFNGMIDRRPALICRCADADDVVAASTWPVRTTWRCPPTEVATG